MLQDEIGKRNIPQLFPSKDIDIEWEDMRASIVETFSANVYGITPAPPLSVRADVKSIDRIAFAGKATHKHVMIDFDTPSGEFGFPVDMVIPNVERPVPLCIFVSFHSYKESYETPIEEIIDSGIALAIIHYQTVTSDDDDMDNGIAGMYPRIDSNAQWGKIGMWAYAASRVMDYAQSIDEIDQDSIVCAGHSRLGKTALWCAVQDTRFWGAFVNNSGCSGVAVSRGKQGETISDICARFPYWFCRNYMQYIDNEENMPFDQHQLVASMAPRYLYTCSASADTWADPSSEYMSCYLASEAYTRLGQMGLVGEDRYPQIGDIYNKGNIGYHMREGEHFLSRYDWLRFVDYMKMHM